MTSNLAPHNDQNKNHSIDDFFGQFIRKNVRHLRRQDIARFLDLRVILCPECYQEKLPLNPTSDGYLICSICNIHWDLLARPLPGDGLVTVSRLRSDGSVYVRKVKPSTQLDFLEVPF